MWRGEATFALLSLPLSPTCSPPRFTLVLAAHHDTPRNTNTMPRGRAEGPLLLKRAMAPTTEEWAAARATHEARVHNRTAPGGDDDKWEVIHCGDNIFVAPGGTNNDAVRSDQLDHLEVKRVVEIRKHGRKRKCILRCQDYVRLGELEANGTAHEDPPTRAIVRQMGRYEVGLTTRESLVWQDSVQDAAAVVVVSACEASVPPTVPGQYSTRSDVMFSNVAQDGEQAVWRVLTAPKRYCTDTCRYEGGYDGGKHTVRFCSDASCQVWYHVDCLGQGRRGGAIDWPTAWMEDRCEQVQGWVATADDENGTAWSRAVRHPIERAPRQKRHAGDLPYRQEMFSMEAVLVRLRSELEIEVGHERGATLLGGLRGRIEEMVGEYHDRAEIVERLAREVYSATQQGSALEYHSCPSCGKWI
ncbi:hypothetical protein LXA43DRAFT_1068918 [Ganoderma leucocontextum]|nr:hypothetical protein LXA43DRAFT_1068918 [Ganoderma leucocontextum]